MPSTELILSDFNQQERSLLSSILAEDSSVELNPQHLNPDQLWSALNVCKKIMDGIGRADKKIKAVLGKILLQLAEQPEVLQAHGFRSFDHFLTMGVPELFNISESEAHHLVRIERTLGSVMTPDLYKDIGIAKLQIIARIADNNERARATPRTNRDRKEYIEKLFDKAKGMTTRQLREYSCEVSGMERGSMDFAVIQIETNRAFKQRWEEFCREPAVIAAVGTDNRSAILEALMGEASAEWFAQAQTQDVA